LSAGELDEGVDRLDQQIATMLFLWHRLPGEICADLRITRSRFDASVTRICKAVTGFTDQQHFALHEIRQKRIAAIPVPEPNLPRYLGRAIAAIGREPTFEQAAKAVARYWRMMVMYPGDRRRRPECVVTARHLSDDPLHTLGLNDRADPDWVVYVVAPRTREKALREITRDPTRDRGNNSRVFQ
jgi:hypothetical protein